ncbi:hypothetical protein L195_g056122 [Trifolium pratense]|uniref:Uncharacterized protein n=1 Tax=Trifolium pratense TaxID=57577 RepID=A0A2K3KPX9_TRIPR|nr:hypothetical protein L195_g056122 [Trifolium pratense]
MVLIWGVMVKVTEGVDSETSYLGQHGNIDLGQSQIIMPNIPRPPNSDGNTPIFITSKQHQNHALMVDSDEFVDASDNGATGDSESDMEVVVETPRLDQ